MLQPPRWPLWCLALLILVTHGLLLLMDGVYWDGWLMKIADVSGDYDAAAELYRVGNRHVEAVMVAGLMRLPGFLPAFRLLAFVSVGAVGFAVYGILLASRLVNRPTAVMVAALALVYPSYEIAFNTIMTTFQVFMACFFVGFWAWFRADAANQPGGRRHLGFSLVGLALIVFSFNMNSMLTFFFGMLALFYWMQAAHAAKPVYDLAFARDFARRYAYLALLPFLFFGLTRAVFEPPEISDYNEPQLTPDAFQGMVVGLQAGSYEQFHAALGFLLAYPVLGALLIGGVGALVWRLPEDWLHLPANRLRPGEWLLLGGGMLVLAIFPYVAVNKTPIADGWWTRYMILSPLPVALLVMGVFQWLGYDAAGRVRRPALLGLGVLALLFMGHSLNNYISYQARWVRDRSVIEQLAAQAPDTDPGLLWINDNYPVGLETRYRPYEWEGIFLLAWGARQGYPMLAPYDTLAAHRTITPQNAPDALRGCAWRVTVEPGPRPASYRDTWGLTARYLAFRYLYPPGMDGYMAGVTEVTMQPIPSPFSTACAAQPALPPPLQGLTLRQQFDLLDWLDDQAEARAAAEPSSARGAYLAARDLATLRAAYDGPHCADLAPPFDTPDAERLCLFAALTLAAE